MAAFAAFNAAEWASWIAVLVYAFGRGGAATAGLVALLQLVPAGLFAPLAAVLSDRHDPSRVLTAGYAVQGLAMLATSAAIYLEFAPPLAYVLAVSAAVAITITRPAQSVLIPALTASADELTAANIAAGWIESVSMLVGPAGAGVLLSVGGPATVLVATSGLALLAAVIVIPVRATRRAATGGGDAGAVAEAVAGFRLLKHAADPRHVVGVLATQYAGIGALDVLLVVLAIDVLGIGDGGAGYLNAAFGAGGVVGLAGTVLLVGKRRLVPALLIGITMWTLSFLVLALSPPILSTLLLLCAAGAGRSLVDVAGRTLLQRCAPPEVLGRVFGVLEGLSMAGLAIGSIAAPAAVALWGIEGALVATAAFIPAAAAVAGRRILDIDSRATVPVVEIALLRSTPVFAAMPTPSLEALARRLVVVSVPANEIIFREGEPSDRCYVISQGEVDVLEDSVAVTTIGRGDTVGELALLNDTPHSATVRARTDVHLFALDKANLMSALEAHPESAHEAGRMMRERLLVAAEQYRSARA